MAPDGSIYVADWNDAGVGGHNMADQNLETMTGRVYRVAPTDGRLTVPKLEPANRRGLRRGIAIAQSGNALSGLDETARNAGRGGKGIAEALEEQ